MNGLRNADGGLRKVLRAAAALPPAQARAVVGAILAKEENAADLQSAGKAFESDMQPVRDAIVEALQAGDVEALRGLRGMLPELLAEVIGNKALENHFAFLLGKAVVKGMRQEDRSDRTDPTDPTDLGKAGQP